MKVELYNEMKKDPETAASHAARVCYLSDDSAKNKEGKLLLHEKIDVKGRLVDTGHHSTLEHSYFTFHISDMPVSLAVFGLHLTGPFYNTDQRSGRFSKMYENPDFEAIEKSLHECYPDKDLTKVMAWIKKGCRIYQENLPRLTEEAQKAIQTERPFVNDKYIEQNAPKFAQEQLRMFISQCAPTSMDYTINVAALMALYRTAWSPEMRLLTQKMVDEVLKVHPELAYMFDKNKQNKKDLAPVFMPHEARVVSTPTVMVTDAMIKSNEITPPNNVDSLDTLYFSPETMDNTQQVVQTEAIMSCATYGQDQRHRSVKRGKPVFTGHFYLPPLLKKSDLRDIAKEYMQEWLDLRKEVGDSLVTTIAPYGAMVASKKTYDMNALFHEQAKRSCWCAQEEIYQMSVQLRRSLENKIGREDVMQCMAPPCAKSGKCQEGVRYCGRHFKHVPLSYYFPDRTV